MLFDVSNLAVVLIIGLHEKLPHRCAKTPMIAVLCVYTTVVRTELSRIQVHACC